MVRSYLFLLFKSILKKIYNFLFLYLLQINISLMFLNYFGVLILKLIFKNKKKYYFDIFLSKKYFKKQLQPYLISSNKWLNLNTERKIGWGWEGRTLLQNTKFYL